MDQELCNEHTVKLAEMNVKIDSLKSEVADLRKDVKSGNDKVLNLFSKTLERQDKAQNKSFDFFGKLTTITFRVVAILALVAWGAEKCVKFL